MATNRDVNINIKTKTDSKALDTVNKKLVNLGKSTAKTSKATTKALTAEEKAEKKLVAETIRLTKAKNKAEIAAHKHEKALNKEAVAMRKLPKLQQNATASLRKSTQAAGKAKKANIDLGRSTLLASQGYEDLQFGIGGVLNNIPPLVMALGGTAGLAGVISITAVVASQLGGVFNTTKDKTKELETAFDDLAKKKAETLNAELSEKESHEEFQRLMKGDEESVSSLISKIEDLATKKSEIKALERAIRIGEINNEIAKIREAGGSEAGIARATTPLISEKARLGEEGTVEKMSDKVALLEESNKILAAQIKRDEKTFKENARPDPLLSSGIEHARRSAERAEFSKNQALERVVSTDAEKAGVFERRSIRRADTGQGAALSPGAIKKTEEAKTKRESNIDDFNKALKSIAEAQEIEQDSVRAERTDEALKVITKLSQSILKDAKSRTISSGEQTIVTAARNVENFRGLSSIEGQRRSGVKRRELEQSDRADKATAAASRLGSSQGVIEDRVLAIDHLKEVIKKQTELNAITQKGRDLSAADVTKKAIEKDRKEAEAGSKRGEALRESTAAGARTSARGGETLASGLERAGREGLIAPSLRGKAKSTTAGLREGGATSGEAEGSVSVLRDVREALRGTNKASQVQLKLVNDLIGIAQKTADQLRVSERLIKKQQKEVDALKKNAKRQP